MVASARVVINFVSGQKEAQKDSANLLKQLEALDRKQSQLQANAAVLAPRVDTSELHGLNELLDIKQAHLRQTSAVAASNPIKVRVEYQDPGFTPQGGPQQVAAPALSAESLTGLREGITSAISEGLEGLQDTGGGLTDILLAPLRAVGGLGKEIGSGLLFGLTQTVSQNLGTGLLTSIERQLGPLVGNTELLGEKAADALGSGLRSGAASVGDFIPNFVEQQIDRIDDRKLKEKLSNLFEQAQGLPQAAGQALTDALGGEQVVRQRNLATSNLSTNREDTERSAAREQAAVELRQSLRALEEARAAVGGSGSVDLNEIRRLLANEQAEIAQLNAALSEASTDETANQIAGQINDRANEFDRLRGIIEQQESASQQRQQALAQAQSRVSEARQAVEQFITRRPQAFVELAQDVLGEDFNLDSLPEIVVDEGLLANRGAAANFNVGLNRITVSNELLDAIESNSLTPEQAKIIAEEIAHAKDLEFGNFQGLQSRLTGQLTGAAGSAIDLSIDEFETLVDELSRYDENIRDIEESGKRQAQQAANQFTQRQQQRGQRDFAADAVSQLRSVNTSLAGSGSQARDLGSLLDAAGQNSNELLAEYAQTIEKLATVASGLQTSVVARAFEGNLDTGRQEQAQATIEALQTKAEELQQRLQADTARANQAVQRLDVEKDLDRLGETFGEELIGLVRSSDELGDRLESAVNRSIGLENAEQIQQVASKKIDAVNDFFVNIGQLLQGVAAEYEDSISEQQLQTIETVIRSKFNAIAESVSTIEEIVDTQIQRLNPQPASLATTQPSAQGFRQQATAVAGQAGQLARRGVDLAQDVISSPQAQALGAAVSNTTEALGRFARAGYKGAELVESLALDLVPAGRGIKALGKQVAVPALLTAGAAQVPGGAEVLNLLQGSISSVAGPLIQSFGADLTAQAGGAIAANVPNLLQGAFTGAASSLIEAGTIAAQSVVVQGATLLIGGKAAEAVLKAPFQIAEAANDRRRDTLALPPSSEPLQLSPSAEPVSIPLDLAVEREKLLVEVGPTADEPKKIAAEIDVVRTGEQAQRNEPRQLANDIARKAGEGARAVVNTAAAADELARKAIVEAQNIEDAFSRLYQSFQQALREQNNSDARAYQQGLRDFATKAKSQIDQTIAGLKDAGADADIRSQLGGVKGRLTRRQNLANAVDVDFEVEDFSLDNLRGVVKASNKAFDELNDAFNGAIARLANIEKEARTLDTLKVAATSDRAKAVGQDLAVNAVGFGLSRVGSELGDVGALAGDLAGALSARLGITFTEAIKDAFTRLDGTPAFEAAGQLEKSSLVLQQASKEFLGAAEDLRQNLSSDLFGFAVGNAAGAASPIPLTGAAVATGVVPQLRRAQDSLRQRFSPAQEDEFALDSLSSDAKAVARRLSNAARAQVDSVLNGLEQLAVTIQGQSSTQFGRQNNEFTAQNSQVSATLNRLQRAVDRSTEGNSIEVDAVFEREIESINRDIQKIIDEQVKRVENFGRTVDQAIADIDSRDGQRTFRDNNREALDNQGRLQRLQQQGIGDGPSELLVRDETQVIGDSLIGQLKRFLKDFNEDIEGAIRDRFNQLLRDSSTVEADLRTSATISGNRGDTRQQELQTNTANRLNEVRASAQRITDQDVLSKEDIRQLDQLEKQIRDVYEQLGRPVPDNLSGGVEREAARAGRALQGLGKVALAAVAAFAFSQVADELRQFGREALLAFADFDTSIRTFGVVTQATEEELAGVRAEVERLSAATTKTPQEIADTATEMGKLGFTAQQTQGALAGVIKSSEATGESLEDTGKVVGAALNQFGLLNGTTEDIQRNSIRTADLLTAASNASATGTQDLGDSLTYVGSTAAAANQSLDETIKVLALAGKVGLVGSVAGTGFAQAIRRIDLASASATTEFQDLVTRGSGPAVDAFNKLNLNIRDSEGALIPFSDALEQVRTGLEGFSEADQALVLNALFQQQGGNFVKNILAIPEEARKQIEAEFSAVGGLSDRASEQLTAGLGGALKLLESSASLAQQELGEFAAKGVEPAVRAATGLINSFLAIPEPLRNAALATGVLTVAVGGLLAAATAYQTFNVGAIVAETAKTAATIAGSVATNIAAGATTRYAAVTGLLTKQISLAAIAEKGYAISKTASAVAQSLLTSATAAYTTVTTGGLLPALARVGASLTATATAATASAGAMLAAAAPALALGGAIASIGLVVNTFQSVRGGAERTEEGIKQLDQATQELDLTLKNLGKSSSELAANGDGLIPESLIEDAREELNGLEKLLDNVRDGAGLRTAAEERATDQVNKAARLLNQVNASEVRNFEFSKTAASASAQEREAYNKTIDATIQTLRNAEKPTAAIAAQQEETIARLERQREAINAAAQAQVDAGNIPQGDAAPALTVGELIEARDVRLAKAIEAEELANQEIIALEIEGLASKEEIESKKLDATRSRIAAENAAERALINSLEDAGPQAEVENEKTRVDAIKQSEDQIRALRTQSLEARLGEVESAAEREKQLRQDALDQAGELADQRLQSISDAEANAQLQVARQEEQGLLNKEQVEQRKAEITKSRIEQEIEAERNRIALLQEQGPLEDEEQEASRVEQIQQAQRRITQLETEGINERAKAREDATRAAIEAEREAVEAVRDAQREALEIIEDSALERQILLQQQVNAARAAGQSEREIANLTSESELQSKREELEAKLQAEQDYLAELEALPQPNDPDAVEEREASVRQSRRDTSNLILELLQLEADEQKRVSDLALQQIDDRRTAIEEQAAIINAANESRSTLISAQTRLLESQQSLEENSIQRRIDAIEAEGDSKESQAQADRARANLQLELEETRQRNLEQRLVLEREAFDLAQAKALLDAQIAIAEREIALEEAVINGETEKQIALKQKLLDLEKERLGSIQQAQGLEREAFGNEQELQRRQAQDAIDAADRRAAEAEKKLRDSEPSDRGRSGNTIRPRTIRPRTIRSGDGGGDAAERQSFSTTAAGDRTGLTLDRIDKFGEIIAEPLKTLETPSSQLLEAAGQLQRAAEFLLSPSEAAGFLGTVGGAQEAENQLKLERNAAAQREANQAKMIGGIQLDQVPGNIVEVESTLSTSFQNLATAADTVSQSFGNVPEVKALFTGGPLGSGQVSAIAERGPELVTSRAGAVLVQSPGIFRASHDSYVHNAADTARILKQGETVNASVIAHAMQQPVSVAGISKTMTSINRVDQLRPEGIGVVESLLTELVRQQQRSQYLLGKINDSNLMAADGTHKTAAGIAEIPRVLNGATKAQYARILDVIRRGNY